MARGIGFMLAAWLGAATLAAQTGTGAIQGTVKDSSGAVVPGATVVAEHSGTARRYQTSTNGSTCASTPISSTS